MREFIESLSDPQVVDVRRRPQPLANGQVRKSLRQQRAVDVAGPGGKRPYQVLEQIEALIKARFPQYR